MINERKSKQSSIAITIYFFIISQHVQYQRRQAQRARRAILPQGAARDLGPHHSPLQHVLADLRHFLRVLHSAGVTAMLLEGRQGLRYIILGHGRRDKLILLALPWRSLHTAGLGLRLLRIIKR